MKTASGILQKIKNVLYAVLKVPLSIPTTQSTILLTHQTAKILCAILANMDAETMKLDRAEMNKAAALRWLT